MSELRVCTNRRKKGRGAGWNDVVEFGRTIGLKNILRFLGGGEVR